MQFTINLSRKKVYAILFILSLVASFGAGFYVHATSPTPAANTQYDASGPYAGAPDFTIYQDPTTSLYCAKNAYGNITLSSTNASAVVNNAFDNSIDRDSVYIKGLVSFTNPILIPNYHNLFWDNALLATANMTALIMPKTNPCKSIVVEGIGNYAKLDCGASSGVFSGGINFTSTQGEALNFRNFNITNNKLTGFFAQSLNIINVDSVWNIGTGADVAATGFYLNIVADSRMDNIGVSNCAGWNVYWGYGSTNEGSDWYLGGATSAATGSGGELTFIGVTRGQWSNIRIDNSGTHGAYFDGCQFNTMNNWHLTHESQDTKVAYWLYNSHNNTSTNFVIDADLTRAGTGSVNWNWGQYETGGSTNNIYSNFIQWNVNTYNTTDTGSRYVQSFNGATYIP